MANPIKVLVLIDGNDILSITTDEPGIDIHVIVATYEFGADTRNVVAIPQSPDEPETQALGILANNFAQVDPEWIKLVTTAPKWEGDLPIEQYETDEEGMQALWEHVRDAGKGE